jgi:hypothetical protein
LCVKYGIDPSIGCDNAFLVSALNSDDPGTLNILTGLWQMPNDIVRAAFGDDGFNVQDTGSRVPPVSFGADMGSPECRARCGIDSNGNKAPQ